MTGRSRRVEQASVYVENVGGMLLEKALCLGRQRSPDKSLIQISPIAGVFFNDKSPVMIPTLVGGSLYSQQRNAALSHGARHNKRRRSSVRTGPTSVRLLGTTDDTGCHGTASQFEKLPTRPIGKTKLGHASIIRGKLQADNLKGTSGSRTMALSNVYANSAMDDPATGDEPCLNH